MPTANKSVLETRADNLWRIINRDFDGEPKKLAKKLGLKITTVNKYLNPNSERPCNTRAAREIEHKLGETRGFLDRVHGQKKELYFITIGTDARHTNEIVQLLQLEESVKECTVVFGDFDILIKVEVDSNQFLELLMSKIVRLPGVTSTNTYLAINGLHWQRRQEEEMELSPREVFSSHNNGVDDFIHNKIAHLFDEITELEKGEVTAKDGDAIALKPHEIIEGTYETLYTTKNPLRKIASFNQFLNKEEELIDMGVESRRILLIEDSYKKSWDKVEGDYKTFTKIGSKVRFLFTKDWVQTPLSETPEEITILDATSVVARREDQRRYLIKRSAPIVNSYVSVFDANWEKSFSFNEVHEMLYQVSEDA